MTEIQGWIIIGLLVWVILYLCGFKKKYMWFNELANANDTVKISELLKMNEILEDIKHNMGIK